MGFAAKLAAAQQNQQNQQPPPRQTMPSTNSGSSGTYGGAPPSGYTGGPPPPAALRPGGYQPSQYQAYPGSPPPTQGSAPYPPQGGPGAPPPNAPYGGQGRPGPPPGPPGGQPYGQPSGQYGPPGGAPGPQGGPATPQQIDAYRRLLEDTIREKQLERFYPPGSRSLDGLVQFLANEGPSRLQRIVHELNVPMEVATDLMKLALFDIVLYVDDSGSIEFEEKGLRKEQLRQILSIVATVASTFDQDGIEVRFMNSAEEGHGVRNPDDVERLVSRVRFSGLTPLGTSLRQKVVEPLVVGPLRSGRLQKPVLIITITDGQPAGEAHSTVRDTISYAVREVQRAQFGAGTVSFQFSQVGNDTRARDFLSELDEDPEIGQLIDCTSNLEVEQDEMSRANPPVHLTRELWCAKLMLGAIDSSYDTKDEKQARRGGPGGPPPGPPQGSYGGGGYGQAPPPPQGAPYGAPPSGYAPNPYNQQPGYPPQHQQQPPYSGGHPGNAPGYGQGQPYGYGAPPPSGSGGYPPSGGYGQAPPPPRRY